VGCEGTEQKYSWKDVIPPWQAGVAGSLGSMLQGQLGQPATRYTGPLTTGVDPLLTAGAGALMGMQGHGYSPPPYMGYGGGGGGASGVPGGGGGNQGWQQSLMDYYNSPEFWGAMEDQYSMLPWEIPYYDWGGWNNAPYGNPPPFKPPPPSGWVK